jgi:hypothetical protein
MGASRESRKGCSRFGQNPKEPRARVWAVLESPDLAGSGLGANVGGGAVHSST